MAYLHVGPSWLSGKHFQASLLALVCNRSPHLKEILLNEVSVPAVVTNIPGPPEEAELGGSRILRWTALPPQAGKGTAGIGKPFPHSGPGLAVDV